MNSHPSDNRWLALTRRIKQWGIELGLDAVGIAQCNLEQAENRLESWLAEGCQGEMDYMARHGRKRSRPNLLLPGTLRVISARLDYLPEPPHRAEALLQTPQTAFISRYALGRDYHKVLRKRLQRLAERIERETGDGGQRVFVDSAPVLEKPLAQQAGLGWIGKHTNLIAREAGSWFFLGEIYTGLPLIPDRPEASHCGRCRACIDICPTRAITAPYQLDARRCISYLTIELKGSIPLAFRAAIGNRIYGCDDCQQVCPWNRFARLTQEPDFLPRQGLDSADLIALFSWSEAEFLERTAGSAIRRLGHERWLRNLALGLGNMPPSPEVLEALRGRLDHPSPMVREHLAWALEQQGEKQRRLAT
ncbi:MAG: tRNA epoxyqueuosine(34) reductase QueG [Candidatus Thiodiazotropha sp.]|jgi:epoxyqueuosine reductase